MSVEDWAEICRLHRAEQLSICQPDAAALLGYIAHLEALGLELVELRRPAGGDGGSHGCPWCGRAGAGMLANGTAARSRS